MSPVQFVTYLSARTVVITLGITIIATVLGGIALAFYGDSTKYILPAGIVAIGSASVGALAGLLAPSPKGNS